MADNGGSTGIFDKIKNIIKNINTIVIPMGFLVGAMSMMVTVVDFVNLFEKHDEAKYQGWYAFKIVGNAVVREYKNRKAAWWEILPRFNFNSAPHSNQTTLFYTDFPINREDLRNEGSTVYDMSVLENRDISYYDPRQGIEKHKKNTGTIHAFILQVIAEAEEKGEENPLICLYVVGSGRSTIESKFFVIVKAAKAKQVKNSDISFSGETHYSGAKTKAEARTREACSEYEQDGGFINIDDITIQQE